MTVRTSRRTVTFTHSFSLSGIEDVQPPGTYTVETDEELLQSFSFPAYRRVATVIFLPSQPGGAISLRAISIDPSDLEKARERDVTIS